jgi:hypothetical protein
MPTVLAGQSYDLQDSPENITLRFFRDRWKLQKDGAIPAKNEITFNLFGWSGRKSYQISVESSNTPPIITPMAIGQEQLLQYRDPIYVHVWIVKNKDVVPPQMHHITQRVEQIVLENVTNIGYGLTAIRLTQPFNMIELVSGRQGGTFGNQTEVSLWHSRATVELLYYRYTYNVLGGVRASKTHKYNIVVV